MIKLKNVLRCYAMGIKGISGAFELSRNQMECLAPSSSSGRLRTCSSPAHPVPAKVSCLLHWDTRPANPVYVSSMQMRQNYWML